MYPFNGKEALLQGPTSWTLKAMKNLVLARGSGPSACRNGEAAMQFRAAAPDHLRLTATTGCWPAAPAQAPAAAVAEARLPASFMVLLIGSGAHLARTLAPNTQQGWPAVTPCSPCHTQPTPPHPTASRE